MVPQGGRGGLARDDAQALAWYRRAAAAGDEQAVQELAAGGSLRGDLSALIISVEPPSRRLASKARAAARHAVPGPASTFFLALAFASNSGRINPGGDR